MYQPIEFFSTVVDTVARVIAPAVVVEEVHNGFDYLAFFGTLVATLAGAGIGVWGAEWVRATTHSTEATARKAEQEDAEWNRRDAITKALIYELSVQFTQWCEWKEKLSERRVPVRRPFPLPVCRKITDYTEIFSPIIINAISVYYHTQSYRLQWIGEATLEERSTTKNIEKAEKDLSALAFISHVVLGLLDKIPDESRSLEKEPVFTLASPEYQYRRKIVNRDVSLDDVVLKRRRPVSTEVREGRIARAWKELNTPT